MLSVLRYILLASSGQAFMITDIDTLAPMFRVNTEQSREWVRSVLELRTRILFPGVPLLGQQVVDCEVGYSANALPNSSSYCYAKT